MYNAEKYIEETIQSIFNQDEHGLSYEIIIVDDLSKDNSKEIVRNIKSSKIKLIELNKNEGSANARNIGIQSAKGKWIQFVDCDDKICNDLYKKFQNSQKPEINCYVFSALFVYADYTVKRTIIDVKDKSAFGYFYTIWNKFIKRDICMEFKNVSRQNEDVCFVFDMMNEKDLKISLIEDAYYIYNCKNAQSKMSNFNIKEYLNMFNYIYDRIDSSDKLTKMFFLESFVGIVFSKGMPLGMSLKVAIKTTFKLYNYLPSVYFKGIRNAIKNTRI